MPLVKLIQKLIYDLISHKYFIIKLCLISLITLIVLHLVEIFIFWNKKNPSAKYDNALTDIDAVYTWVNGSDHIFIESMRKYSNIKENFHISRFDDKSELKYSLRSIEKYAPWIRHVYIVTNGQVPTWLDMEYDKVSIISHEELTSSKVLPTFSSPAIETFIHKIPKLSRFFLYLNDDIFLGDYVWLDDFLTLSRGFRLFLAWNAPSCALDCPWSYIGDGSCDNQCNTIECQYDGGDCENDFFEGLHKEDGYTINSKMPTTLEASIEHTTKTPEEKFTYSNKTNIKNLIYSKTHTNITNLIISHNKLYLMRSKRTRKRQNINTSKNIFSQNNGTSNIQRDAYGDSLVHTNKIFNMKYGFKNRKVPAHVPILVDTQIMESLQNDFEEEVIATRQRKFRSSFDFQYSFSYYHYIMSETKNLTASSIFDEFDTDHSGTWSDRELRTFLTRTNELPLEWGAIDFFGTVLKSCTNKNTIHISTPPNERYLDSDIPIIAKDIVVTCAPLVGMLLENFGTANRYKFEVIKQSSEYSTFQMLSSNASEVVATLDDIRKFPKKFVCINDNLDPNRPEDNELAKALLEDFYMSLFPIKSKFELPDDFRNRFRYINDYNAFTYNVRCLQILMYAIVSSIVPIIFCRFCVRKRTRRRYLIV